MQKDTFRPHPSPQNLLLVNPWITDFAAYDFWIKPMGLLYLAAVLRKAGFHPLLIDCMDRCHPEVLRWQGLTSTQNRRWSTGKFLRTPVVKPAAYRDVPRLYCRYGMPEEIFDKLCLDGPAPSAILVTSGMTYWYPGLQMAIARLRKLFPGTPILLGGIYATLCAEHARLHSGADVVIAGEAEAIIVDEIGKLIGSIDNKRELNVRRGEGESGGKGESSLDDLPWPAFNLYPRLQFATIMTSRGCPLKCTFCASRIVSGAYRWRSIDGVMAELDWLHRGLGVSEFAFYDDALLTNRDRHFLPLCESIIDSNIRATFHTPNGLQAKFIDATTAQLMWRAGFKTVRLAYESGSEERQRDMSKKVSNESFARAVENLYAAGFGPEELDAYVMMALPGQTFEEVLQSMAYVHTLGVGIRLAAFSPIPGTVDFDRAVEAGDVAHDTDPLLTNNSILPIRLPGAKLSSYYTLAQLAKELNAALPHCCGAGNQCMTANELALRLQRKLTTISHGLAVGC
jgi:radical SAM superfamily enzyme YgiQ (UPF0313 family)